MKIEIEWESSIEAFIRIDGREMRVKMSPGITTLEGVKGKDTDMTMGGIIASQLYSKIADLMQAEAIMYEQTAWDPEPGIAWRRMPESVADDVYARAD